MSQLEKLKRELVLRRYSPKTIDTYLSCAGKMLSTIGYDPTLDAIKDYLLTIKSTAYHKQMVATIHKYFRLVLNRPLSLNDIPYPRGQQKLPDILSVDEVRRLFNTIANFKHKAIVTLLYGCGLRVGELLGLVVSDLNFERMEIKIRAGKGNKDRVVIIDEKMVRLLKNYLSADRPTGYLFTGQYGGQYTQASVNGLLKYWAKKAGIKKPIHAHLLRHAFATHHFEGGTPLSVVQAMLGHSNIKTTQVYARASTGFMRTFATPTDKIL